MKKLLLGLASLGESNNMESRSVTLMVVLLIPRVAIDAQTKRPQPSKSPTTVAERAVMALASRLATARASVTSAAWHYKRTLEELLALQHLLPQDSLPAQKVGRREPGRPRKAAVTRERKS